MSENRSGTDGFLALIVGAAAGAAAALLLAPRTGKETRRRVARWLENMEGCGEDLMAEAESLWEKGKEKMKGAPPPRKGNGES